MHQVRLILTDIDGTLMPFGESHVGPRVHEAFRVAEEAGIRIGPCSGRGRDWVAKIFEDDEKCYRTAVSTNGMELWCDGEPVYAKTFDRDDLLALAEFLEGEPGSGLVCFDGGKPLLVEGSIEDLMVGYPAYGKTCDVVDEVPTFPIVKANVFCANGIEATTDLVARAMEAVPTLDLDVAMPCFSNVMPHGINKASGIDALCARLGCTLDEVVVFGDAGNDLTMLNHVPNSVAVANATPEAAAAARWHIGTCADDAVVDAILALAAGEWPFTK